jgi:hypothetical protein
MAWLSISAAVGLATGLALLAGLIGLVYFLTRDTNGSEINPD